MGCSLQKKLKTEVWCANEIEEYYADTENQGTSKETAEWLVEEEVLLDLKKVAETIQRKMHEPKPKNTTAYFNGFFDACEWVLGLLVEGEE